MRGAKLATWIVVPLRGVGRRISVPYVISMLALFVALGGVGSAATGAKLVLGALNGADRTTSLNSSTEQGPALAVVNRSGRPAASFVVKSGAPFTVNSTTRVPKLNADLLDGSHGVAFQRRVSGTCPAGSAIRTVAANGTVVCQTTSGTTTGTTTVTTTTTGTPAPPAWLLSGNKGTSASNFFGTTDNQPVIVKTNGAEAMRVTPAGDVGIGTAAPIARLESSGPNIGVLGTSASRGVVGRVGQISCPGAPYGVGGCASGTGTGVVGSSDSGPGVVGSTTSGRGVQGSSGTGIGVIGDSKVRGVVGTVGGTSCAGTYGVGGCTGASNAVGVFGDSAAQGVVGTISGVSCPGAAGVSGCGGKVGDGLLGISAVGPNSITAAAVHAINTAGGDIFIGEANGARKARIDGNGKGFFDGGTQSSGADYADSMRAHLPATLKAGDVLVIDTNHGNEVAKSSGPNSSLVAGVYSTKPSTLGVGTHHIGDSLRGEVPVALVGIVPTKVTTQNGAIRPGDLLTTSSTPGAAMKATPVYVRGVATYRTGTILGKAMEPLSRGSGEINVLVTMR